MSKANLYPGADRARRRLIGTVALLCLILLCPAEPLRAQSDAPSAKVALTAAEAAFIRRHPSIRLGTDGGWEPYVVATPGGRIRGYDADILDRVNALTGADFQLVLGPWREMLKAARERRIDGLSTSAVHEERRDHLNFSDVYISLRKMLLVAKGNPAGIHSIRDLAGKTLVVYRGNLADEKLARGVEGADLMFVDSIEDCIGAVIGGKADATFDNGAILYMANRIGMPYLEMAGDSGSRLDLVFSVRNDWPEALSILNKGLAAIPEHERLLIQRRWFPGAASGLESGSLVPLTAEERRYLLDKGRLRLCVDPQWMPYEYLDADGRYQGIIAEIHDALAKRLGIELEVVRTATWAETLRAVRSARCDLLSAAVETPERSPYLAFTRPFLDMPLVLAARVEQPFIDSILDVSGQTFAVIRNHALQDIFNRRYPGIRLIEVDNPLAGLEAVRKGNAFGFIDTSATIGYAIRKHQLIEVKITGKLDERYSLGVGIVGADPMLLSIYDKALESLPEQIVDQALSRWDSVETVKELDRALLIKILGGLILLGLLIFYRDRVISRYSRRLEEANRRLQILSTTDQLTGVANRRKFTEVFAKEVTRADRYDNALSLIITDIDHFKAVNDSRGHDSGDQVLIKFAELFVQKSRDSDLVVRWGGEEFLILCPQTGLDSARRLAELLRQRVADSDFGIGKPVVTSSFGVAQYQAPESLNDLVARADRALYRAKAEGRNRVCAESPGKQAQTPDAEAEPPEDDRP
ncbi:diguanylate cyclase [Imhoffiella purpurea]|uniref:diguanylate cyclase n=1 Tax=Imhoffiella purpurea TaxID=1249627 RepID=W9V7Q1_9GAMM|nr:transporter substrate-binding domain-containing protein [Imhoffiella purpurea]EXJ15613.1 GGDEF domain protein [Imhoffiella purpurea]